VTVDKNALAPMVRALPAIAGLNEIWQQRPDESDDNYWGFLEWLDKGSNRGAPPARYMAAAAEHEWAVRALAYERAADLATAGAASGQTPEMQIVDSLTRMVQIETQKLLKQSAGEVGTVLTVKDLLSTIALIQDFKDKAVKEGSSRTDLSKLTPDQRKQILDAQRLLRMAAGK
jgi:hypothetical protein